MGSMSDALAIHTTQAEMSHFFIDKMGIINVVSYGALGDGATDDTTAINDAIDAAYDNGGGIVYIPPGVHMVDAETKIQLKDNVTLWFAPGASFQVITNDADSYRVIEISSVDNVTLINPTVTGDRDTHTGVTGEHGHGIVISSGTNVKIYNPVCEDCWGDGFTVYGGENIYVENLVSDNNRRQGLTITSGENVKFVNPKCTNTNGTSPEAGIDIEPNYATDVLKGIWLINPITENNNGTGIVVNLNSFVDADKDIDINIINPRDYGSYNSYYIANVRTSAANVLNGTITIIEPYSKLAQGNGIYVVNYGASKTPHLKIIRPHIVNPNTGDTGADKYGSGISFVRETAETDTFVMGNFEVINPRIVDNRDALLMRKGIHAIDEKNSYFTNAKILDPIEITGVDADKKIGTNSGGFTIRDSLRSATHAQTPAGAKTFYMTGVSYIHNSGTVGMSTFTINQSLDIDCPITFQNFVAGGLKIIPTSATILPLSAVSGKYIQTTDIGGLIKIRKVATGVYMIEEQIGTWTVEA